MSAETPSGGAVGAGPTDSPSSPPDGAEAPIVQAATDSVEPARTIEQTAPIDSAPEKRGRGRPRKNPAGPVLNSVTPAPPRPAPISAPVIAAALPVDYEQMARTAANLWFNVPQLVFGEEWAPETAEVTPIKDAFKDYFEAEKLPRIPPSWGLALVLLTYTTKRVTKPTIKERIYGAVEWVKSKIKR